MKINIQVNDTSSPKQSNIKEHNIFGGDSDASIANPFKASSEIKPGNSQNKDESPKNAKPNGNPFTDF